MLRGFSFSSISGMYSSGRVAALQKAKGFERIQAIVTIRLKNYSSLLGEGMTRSILKTSWSVLNVSRPCLWASPTCLATLREPYKHKQGGLAVEEAEELTLCTQWLLRSLARHRCYRCNRSEHTGRAWSRGCTSRLSNAGKHFRDSLALLGLLVPEIKSIMRDLIKAPHNQICL